MTAWVGIDPGPTWTGIVTRAGTDLLGHWLLHRTADEDVVTGRGVQVGPDWLAAVLQHIARAAAVATTETGTEPRIAVEGLVSPGGFKHGRKDPIRPGPLIGAGMVLGAILARHPDAVVVPPGHNGDQLLATYPPALVTPGERRLGLHRQAKASADIHHCRSAWDVSVQGPGIARYAAAIREASRT